MLLTIVIVMIISIGITFYWLQSQHIEKYKAFYRNPTPFYIPILGNTYLSYGKDVLGFVLYLTKMFGKRFIGYIPHRTYFTSEPEDIKIILNQSLDKSKEVDILKAPFGDSLLLVKANIWKKNRKIMAKGFKQNILDTFVTTFYEKSNNLIDLLRGNNYKNIYELFETLTLDIFIETSLGIKSSILTEKNNSFVRNITEGQRLLFGRIGNIFKMHDFIYFRTPEGKYVKNVLLAGIHNFLKPIISMRKVQLEKEIIINTNKLPLLDLLLNSAEKEKFTDSFISNEITLFASAATDTTAYSLAYALCLLGMHLQVQEKIYEEVMEVIGEGEITTDHLSKLKYTEMALNESMRLLPTVPLLTRQTKIDLDIGPFVIPKNTGIIMCIYNLHRDENIYPNPLVYNPDRFLPENIATRHPYSFLPFSGGPRNCIGWKYAQMSMKVTIANVIRHFHVTTPYESLSDMTFESSVVMNTTHPLEINFIPRET